MLNGDIVVKSELGKGSEFTLTLDVGDVSQVPLIDVTNQGSSSPTVNAPKPAITTSLADLRILFAEDGPDNQRLIAFILRKAGASAYVLKNEAIDQLVDAIDAVLRGQTYTPPTRVRNATTVQKRSARVDSEQLSAREQEVLRLLAAGKGTTEIAELLAISPKTVETYRSRLMNKLAIDNLSGLVRFAIRAGIVSPEE
jgi:DNA-binding NarL/FixJ family response regulator